MIKTEHFSPKILAHRTKNIEKELARFFQHYIDQKSWMQEVEQLKQRFQLDKLKKMDQEALLELQWDEREVEAIVHETVQNVYKYIPHENLSIAFVPAFGFPWFKKLNRSMWVNGFTNGPGRIVIAIPPQPDQGFLQYLIAHEMHHASSLNPIYQLSTDNFPLIEWFKMEGTAEYFSLSLYPDKRWWKDDFTARYEAEYWNHVKDRLKTTDDQLKSKLCFGNKDEGIPTFAGYSFAHRLVLTFMKKYPETSMEELFHIEPERFINAYSKKKL